MSDLCLHVCAMWDFSFYYIVYFTTTLRSPARKKYFQAVTYNFSTIYVYVCACTFPCDINSTMLCDLLNLLKLSKAADGVNQYIVYMTSTLEREIFLNH